MLKIKKILLKFQLELNMIKIIKEVIKMAHFEIFKNKKGQYRWRLRANNNKIVADSAESYVRKSACMRGIEILKSQSSQSIGDGA